MARRRSKSQKRSSSSREDKLDSKSNNKSVSDNNTPTTGQDAPTEVTNGNDPAWYARDPYLARDAGSYYFSYAFGKNYHLRAADNFTVNGSGNAASDTAVPGIVILKMKPTLGFNDKPTSPLTVAANSLYGYVRSMNSGRKNYDPPDLTMFLIGIANIYSAIVWAERLYSLALTFADQNRFIGDALIEANGINANSLRSSLADYRMRLNAFINKMAVYAIPSDISYFNKSAFMYRDIYLENGDGNIKDQIYMYVPDGFYRYTRDADNATMLDYNCTPWNPSNPGQISQIFSYLELLASDVFGDEDVSLMSGDMFKVYGDKILRLTSMPEDLPLPLVYDPMVLWQMKNTYVVDLQRRSNAESTTTSAGSRLKTQHSEFSLGTGRTQAGRPGCVFQDSNGVLISVERTLDTSTSTGTTFITTNLRSYIIAMDKLLCSDLPSPDIGVVLESSRNIISYHDAPKGYGGTETNKGIGWIICGSYVCVNLQVVDLNTGMPNIIGIDQYNGFRSSPKSNEAMFRYIPTIFNMTLDNSANVISGNPCTDINNFVILDQNSITKLHEVALLSLLYVPGIAKLG